MRIERIPMTQINPAPYNPRIDLQPGMREYENLKRSLDRFDLVEPLVWNKRTGNLVGGHQRLKILIEQGRTEVEVSVVDLPDVDEKALNLALNRIQGEWDEELLANLLHELEERHYDLSFTGFNEDEIDNLLSQFTSPLEDDNGDELDAESSNEPITQPGDIWQLGPHRLMCGDSTEIDQVGKLLDGAKVQLVITSPPYNVGKEYDSHDDNQSREEYLTFIRALLFSCKHVLEQGRFICWNISHVPEFDIPSHHSVMMEELGFRFVDSIIWEKPDAVSPRFGVTMQNPYPTYYRPNHTYERVVVYGNEGVALEALYGYETLWIGTKGELEHLPKSGSQRILRLAKQFRGSVWRFPGRGSKEHPAPFPVALPANCMEFYTKPQERVFDCCGGSGTTLIAAQEKGRIAYLMEMSPRYCDVTVDRWEAVTGQKAVRKHGENREAIQAHARSQTTST